MAYPETEVNGHAVTGETAREEGHKEERIDGLWWQMTLIRAGAEEDVRHATYAIRQQEFREMWEMCEEAPIKAFSFLSTDTSIRDNATALVKKGPALKSPLLSQINLEKAKTLLFWGCRHCLRNVHLDRTAKLDIENKLVPKDAAVVRHRSLPQHGQTPEWIFSQMELMDTEMGNQANWRHGKLSGAVYHGGDDLEKVIIRAYQRY
ncbi:hypothetical protein LshimejAT787_1801860 [Lyophyllum shimeji]|uniref:Uncharacterized protein n=1 Tax=Lyophyllum shimeji TaxID=47721 RepID=A0A9P3Q0H7_LYOSH|nr:hypothetical protein LshimejAT787_1801860 [Lyophyllum shimeji]